jgi:hypothetical protein
MIKTSFWIPGNTPSSKNGKVWTGRYFVVSNSVRKWQSGSKGAWKDQKDDFVNLTSGLPMPLFVHLTFIRNRRSLFDYYGPGETIMDEMVHRNWVNDDNVYQVVPVFGKFVHNPSNPGCIIRLLKEPPKYILL